MADAVRNITLCRCCGESVDTQALISHLDVKVTRLDDKWGSRLTGWLKIHAVMLVRTYTAKFMYRYSEGVFAFRTPNKLR